MQALFEEFNAVSHSFYILAAQVFDEACEVFNADPPDSPNFVVVELNESLVEYFFDKLIMAQVL